MIRLPSAPRFLSALLLSGLAACSGGNADTGNGGRPGGAGEGRPGGGGDAPAAAVPVEVAAVDRRSIAAYIETNGVLEAENEVDIVARIAGPIVELATEEGRQVRKGQLLARIDEAETRAQVEIAEVRLREAERAFERATASRENELISEETYEQVLSEKEAAEAQLTDQRIRLGYTRIEAPFNAIVIERAVKLAENVTVNQRLFRISDFDPLLCEIQVPEKELSRLELGQRAHLSVEAWPGDRFPAKLLRISPVVDAETGTIRVTLAVGAGKKLRPGMFASVFLEIDTRENALAMPRTALALESLGDTVFVAQEGEAKRREVKLGYEEADVVEVLEGLEEGERVIVVGQEGLSDGTPVRVVKGPGAEAVAPPGTEPPAAPGDGPPDPERLERIKQRMREQGLSDQQIEERLERMRNGGGPGDREGAASGQGRPEGS
jgi:membrane fusion protein (multidrug efflux system)